MKVFKFGGASVKDAEAVKNVVSIIQKYGDSRLVVVVSAMGKITNSFEKLVDAFYFKKGGIEELLQEIKEFHFNILNTLFEDKQHPIYRDIENTFVEVEWQLEDEPVGTYDFEYDQMVPIGELLSTKIISAYLGEHIIESHWFDARDVIRTDNNYRKAKVDWTLTKEMVQQKVKTYPNVEVFITQGFMGSTSENFTSTLGREGSDFSASILASSLQAEEVVIWKDVEGMLNADPKYFNNTVKLDNISFREAVELAYYGASVIHPKTIKPLQNNNIPLKVKSFVNPASEGSVIDSNEHDDAAIASYIHKDNQILLSISSKDYSFIDEIGLSEVFKLLHDENVSVNIMQNSAISFSLCADYDVRRIDTLIVQLKKSFKVMYNTNVQLLTVRHYNSEVINDLLKGKEVLLEQKSRSTARFVVR